MKSWPFLLLMLGAPSRRGHECETHTESFHSPRSEAVTLGDNTLTRKSTYEESLKQAAVDVAVVS